MIARMGLALLAILIATAVAAQTPRTVYRIEASLAVGAPGADISWLEAAADPREAARRFVGAAAAEGITPRFVGSRSVFFELGIDRFKPIPRGEAPIFGGEHEITLSFRLIDPSTGARLIDETQKLNLWASGFADQDGPKKRLETWIRVAARRWADSLTCRDLPCGPSTDAVAAPSKAIELAPTEQPTTAAVPVQEPQPVIEPAPVQPAPEPVETAVERQEPRLAPLPTQTEPAQPAQNSASATEDGFNLTLGGQTTETSASQPVQRRQPAPRAVIDLSGAIATE